MMTSKAMKRIPLVEKFGPTIQGEGATIGLQTYFLRFGLCDYKCVMCDSMHAVDPIQVKANAKWMTQLEIADLFPDLREQFGCDWITFSGGNPCMHELSLLVSLLHEKGYKITVETQGTLCPAWLQQCDMVTVSPKGPGMGEVFERDKFEYFIKALAGWTSLSCKIVVFNSEDLDFARVVLEYWQSQGYTKDSFYLSQGNPFPPGKGAPVGRDLHINVLRDEYLKLFSLIQKSPRLSSVKYLPQWHVWLWSNQQGV